MTALRHLVVVLGDQLDPDSLALADLDPDRDAVWMCEAAYEARHAWSTKARIAVFLAGMRLFRDALRARGVRVHYRALDEHQAPTLEAALAEDLRRLAPQRVVAVRPGEWRLAEALPRVCAEAGVAWAERADQHFLVDHDEFAAWAKGRKEVRLEHFQRWLRRREGVLMDGDDPAGGAWNFDAENRAAFPKAGPGRLPAPRRFAGADPARDAVREGVLALVRTRFAGHPGELEGFDWPLAPDEAEAALQDFLAHRLPLFGRYQDAIWAGEPWLYHSRLSVALNLKLLHPRRAIAEAERAWREGRAPIEAVEGFIRQVLGWREFVRGVYWLRMPGMLEDNALGADQPLPAFYWTGDTDMACLRDALRQTLDLGYAHHIQRLMVTGLFALLLGVRPKAIHGWYLGVYVDAVEWVELPNVLGMSQYADGGWMVSKPYAASGAYIKRQSNHCAGCRFKPDVRTGPTACPYTTLYWDFLARHAGRFRDHPRAGMQWRNLDRVPAAELAAIRAQADALRVGFAATSPPAHAPAD